MTKTQQVLQLVENERNRQDKIWGGASHDENHSREDWASFIMKYLGKCEELEDAETEYTNKDFKFQEYMTKIAALAVAAIEATGMLGIAAEDQPGTKPPASPVNDAKNPKEFLGPLLEVNSSGKKVLY